MTRARVYSGAIRPDGDWPWTGECGCGWAFWGWDWRITYAQTCKHLREGHGR